jgi:hypothetical protein
MGLRKECSEDVKQSGGTAYSLVGLDEGITTPHSKIYLVIKCCMEFTD